MKHTLTTIAILIFGLTINAQNAKKDVSGNYVALKKESVAVNTGKTFTDSKGETLPVYETEKGKKYVIKVSKKTGKEYKMYLKVEGEVSWEDNIKNPDNGEYVDEVAFNLDIKPSQVTQQQFNDRYGKTNK